MLFLRTRPEKREKRSCSLSGRKDSDTGDTDRESIMSPDITDDLVPMRCSESKDDIKSEPRDSSSPLSVSTPLDPEDMQDFKEDDSQQGIKQEPLLSGSPSNVPEAYSHLSQFFQAQESISKFYARAEQHQKLLSCAYNPPQPPDFNPYVSNPYYESRSVYPPAYGSSESYSPDITTQANAYPGNFSLSSASSLSPGAPSNAPYSYPAPSY